MIKLKDKKVGILGLGQSGMAAAEYLHQQQAQVWILSRGTPTTWPSYAQLESWHMASRCASDKASFPGDLSLVVLSPGISRDHKALRKLKNVPIINEVELAWPKVKAPVIAVTGSNGKTTTVSLLAALLQGMGKKVFLGGNIGTPLCRYALDPHPVDYVILELSSFQLESLREFHPRVAVLLNVVPNHGERYKTLAQYTAAKWQITKNLRGDDTFIFPTAFASLAQSLPCAKVAVDLADAALTEKLAADWDLSSFKLVGRHNLLNLYFCTQVLKSLGLRPADAQAALDKFLGVEFRLARVAAALPFVALNDAKSTNWDATLTAVRSVAETNEQQLPLWVIIGGQRRGRGDDLAPRAAELIQAVQKVLLIGDTTEEYFNLLQGRVAVQRAYTLEAAVRHVVGAGFKGILLFSPGLPSFDQYPNYVARGKDFDLLLEKWAAPT